jgi:hypothetical protein
MYEGVKKKPLRASALILALLFSTVAGTWLLGSASANPYYPAGEVHPKPGTIPPSISISSPINFSAYSVNHISFNFSVTLPQSKPARSTGISQISYSADWKGEPVDLSYPLDSPFCVLENGVANFTFDFYGLPDGNHSISIQAVGIGDYVESGYRIFFFLINSSPSLVLFTVDTIAPAISVLSMENQTYTSADVPLSFAVNETTSQTAYSLDGQENVTAVAGNTTLTGLPNGVHNVTVYAHDLAGNIGASETVTFTVAEEPEPFPTAPVAAASVATVAVALVGLLVYFRKRKHQALSGSLANL